MVRIGSAGAYNGVMEFFALQRAVPMILIPPNPINKKAATFSSKRGGFLAKSVPKGIYWARFTRALREAAIFSLASTS